MRLKKILDSPKDWKSNTTSMNRMVAVICGDTITCSAGGSAVMGRYVVAILASAFKIKV
jgi:hypothetical protein